MAMALSAPRGPIPPPQLTHRIVIPARWGEPEHLARRSARHDALGPQHRPSSAFERRVGVTALMRRAESKGGDRWHPAQVKRVLGTHEGGSA